MAKQASKYLTKKQKAQIDEVKAKIRARIRASKEFDSLQAAVNGFKFSLSQAIRIAGVKGKDSIIKSQEPIKLFHEVIKSELIKHGVNPELIMPPIDTYTNEKKLYGFIKDKTQDVCVLPNNCTQTTEIIDEGMLVGQKDPNGSYLTERILAINVRSQMSSIAKNDDTIGERTFAETMNLHLRCPRMVLGELFVLPVTGFNMAEVKKNNPVFEKIKYEKTGRTKTTAETLENYINSFSFLNERNYRRGEDYKYERVCLLIADFSRRPIKIYHTKRELIADGILPKNSKCAFNKLRFSTFVGDLLRIYDARFGKGKFK